MTPAPPARLRDLVCLGCWAGLASGYLDAGAVELRRWLIEPIVFTGHHTIWTAPVFNAVLFAGLALAGWTAGRVVPWLGSRGVAVFGFGFLGVLGVLYNFPALHRGAALLLSIGVGAQLARLVDTRAEVSARLVRRTLPWLAGFTLLLGGALVGRDVWRERRALASLPPARPGAPNVLLIVLDTVRALNLSLYGYARPTTPELERWARGGTVFSGAYATASWTLPSHASLLTGQNTTELAADWMVPLERTVPTLAEALAAAGYATGGFVANTDYTSAEVGLARGFAHYEDYTLAPGQIARSSALGRALSRIRPARDLLGWHDNLGRKTAPDISAAFLRWADRQRDRPFFALLNYYDAHRPYLPPAPYAERFRTPGVPLNPRLRREVGPDPDTPPAQIQGAIDAYDNAIAYLDAELGALFRELDRRGLAEHTLIIVTSDHGEEFLEHGAWDHGNTLYRPSVEVPLVLRWPGRVPEGRRFHGPVSLRDVPSTVLDLAGVNPVPPFPGRTLARFWRGGPVTPDTVWSAVRQVPRMPLEYPAARGDLIAVLAGGLRYIRNGGDGGEELFDVERDPGERHNLAATPDAAAKIAAFRTLTEGRFRRP